MRLVARPSRRACINIVSGCSSGANALGAKHHPTNPYVLRRQSGDDFFEISGAAAHLNAANRGALIGRRRRENTDGAHILDGTALNGANEHIGLGGVPDQQRWHRIGMLDLLLRARVLEETVRYPRAAKKKYL